MRTGRPRPADLARLPVKGRDGQFVPLAELGRWEETRVDQTIHLKNLERVAYVLAEAAGRPPAECIADILADRRDQHLLASLEGVKKVGSGYVSAAPARPLGERTYLANGGGIAWSVPDGIRVDFAGEGEWDITLGVFRDLGLPSPRRC